MTTRDLKSGRRFIWLIVGGVAVFAVLALAFGQPAPTAGLRHLEQINMVGDTLPVR